MYRAENEIQFIPIFFDPFAASRRMDGIVIQLDPRADPQIGISFPQPIDFIKIDSGVVTIVIGERDIL
jgi:hypothetical protein